VGKRDNARAAIARKVGALEARGLEGIPNTRPRKLVPKPEALAARGLSVPERYADSNETEIGDRIARAVTAMVLLDNATRMALEAREELRALLGSEHHAYKHADAATHAIAIASVSAREVRRRMR
jgi:hypothetical protein